MALLNLRFMQHRLLTGRSSYLVEIGDGCLAVSWSELGDLVAWLVQRSNRVRAGYHKEQTNRSGLRQE